MLSPDGDGQLIRKINKYNKQICMPNALARCTFFYEISIAIYLLNKSHYFWRSDPLIIVYDDLSLITRFLSVGKGVSNMHHKIY